MFISRRFLKSLSPFLIVSCLALPTLQGATEPMLLWPKGAPGQNDFSKPEKDGRSVGKIMAVTFVTAPTITLFQPPDELRTGAAVLVCPGGGYDHLAFDKEGTKICEWLNSIGVAGVLLKYRVPAAQGLPKYAPALQDAQRALGIVRSQAAAWKIDPARIGIIGFSAGGHLAAALGSNFQTRTYPSVDQSDTVSCRPDFAMLIYPAYLAVEGPEWYKLAPEVAVSGSTPPTFLVQTEDDRIRVENSLSYYFALKQEHVPGELHLYASGGHGYGLYPTVDGLRDWPARARDWLLTTHMIPKVK